MTTKKPEITQFSSLEDINKKCASLIVSLAAESIKTRGGFSLVLSGGSTPKSLYELLATPEIRDQINWKKVHFFWGDDRCVPPDHQASNFKMAQTSLLNKIPVPQNQIFRMKGERDPEAGALDYEQILKSSLLLWKNPDPNYNMPVFDLVLLGLGNDGHTASLFPESDILHEKKRLVCAAPAPGVEPNVPRLTLTIPVINSARNVWFITAGTQKLEIVKKIAAKEKPLDYPAAKIAPNGNLLWFVTT